MSTLIFDVETDGLLDTMTKVHCVGIYNTDTGEYTSYEKEEEIDKARDLLNGASCIVGHNILHFDNIALDLRPSGVVRDTLVMSWLMFPHIKDSDFQSNKLPSRLIGSHSLEAWGYRLGQLKMSSPTDWSKCTPELLEYLKQDVAVTTNLWGLCVKESESWGLNIFDSSPLPGKDCIQLEHDAAQVCYKIESNGWEIDVPKILSLAATLTAKQQELYEELQEVFPPLESVEIFIPKVNNSKLGYRKGVPVQKHKITKFNPGSRQQVGSRLRSLGWKPHEFTADGHPKVDGEILSKLPYKEAKKLAEYFLLDKRLGQIANGDHAWLAHAKQTQEGFRVHGRILSGGTHTGRCSHRSPNVAQVPATGVPYGEECRECWVADPGQMLVGVDAEGLEQRTLAGYAASCGGQEYVKAILNGRKEEGTDLHSINARLIGTDRDTAKTFFYALIYGAGNKKLGQILGKSAGAGNAAKERLIKGVPVLGDLTSLVKKRYKERGYLIGLDGRHLYPRSESSALNTLLQSAGAILMKRALISLDRRSPPGVKIVGFIHDEIQASVPKEEVDRYRETAVQAIEEAGTYYDFLCPLAAETNIGYTWAETH